MQFTDNLTEYNVLVWYNKFSSNEDLVPFIDEVHTRLIERASWNDDEDVSILKNISIKDIFYEHINDEGLITSMVDCYDEDSIYGHIKDLESIYNEIRDTLWDNGILQQVYEEKQDYTMDEIQYYIAEHYKKWR